MRCMCRRQAAEHIFTDMQQYVDFGGLLFSMLTKKPSSADIERIVKDAVAIEKAFILEVRDPWNPSDCYWHHQERSSQRRRE